MCVVKDGQREPAPLEDAPTPAISVVIAAYNEGKVIEKTLRSVVASDYRGEIRVPLINLGRETFRVSRGMRVAQLVVAPVARVSWDEVDELFRGRG